MTHCLPAFQFALLSCPVPSSSVIVSYLQFLDCTSGNALYSKENYHEQNWGYIVDAKNEKDKVSVLLSIVFGRRQAPVPSSTYSFVRLVGAYS